MRGMHSIMLQQLEAAVGGQLETLDVPGSLPDKEIVRRILAGDGASFELLMRRYNQRVFRVVRSIVRDDDEAEDIVQESYVRAFEHLSQFEGRATFATWLTRIAVNEALARKRRDKVINYMDFDDPKNVNLEPYLVNGHADHRACNNELRDVLTRAIDGLPDDMRTVFTLRVVEELDIDETAACLEISESNVKVRLHRARSLLRQRIDEQIGAGVRQVYQFDGKRCDRIVNAVLQRLSRQFGT
jgi:RNA polymerase sigma-70 factor, ECF subfamily